MNLIIKGLIAITFTIFSSCKQKDGKKTEIGKSTYTVLKEDVLYIPEKSQVSTYVVYNDTIYEEPVLKRIALEVYNTSKKKPLENNEQATIIMVYIYASEEDYANNKTNSITTLYKGDRDNQPEIAYTMPSKVISEQPKTPAIPEETGAKETSNEDIQKVNQQFFSVWDGSNPEFVEAVKNNMNDPDSFKHVETKYDDKGSYLRIQMKYRGKNGFNAMITTTSTCTFNKSDRTVSDIK